MKKKTSLENVCLEKKNKDELNLFIKQAAKILNDRQRYLEILSGRRTESGKSMYSEEQIRNLEVTDVLYRLSSKAKELNPGQKKKSIGGSVRFSGKASEKYETAYSRAKELHRLLGLRYTTVSGLEKNLESRKKGILDQIFTNEKERQKFSHLSDKKWDLIFYLFEQSDKHGFPSEVIFEEVIKWTAKGEEIFKTKEEFDKWFKLELEKQGSSITLEKDLRAFRDKIRFIRKGMNAGERRENKLWYYDDILKDFFSSNKDDQDQWGAKK